MAHMFKVKNAALKNWDEIRYFIEFEMNGQRFHIDTTWKDGKCSIGDTIAHRGYSGETTVPVCSFCGRSFIDCEICPEFYYNSAKTQIIADQLVELLKDELKELPFDFDNPFISINRGKKLASLIKIARIRGDKINGIFDDYGRYIASGSFVAPDYNDPQLLEDDGWFFQKTAYNVVYAIGYEKQVMGEPAHSTFESDLLYDYLVPEELLDRSNPFVDLEVEWKRQYVLQTLSYVDEHGRRNESYVFLKRMMEYNFPKETVHKFLDNWIDVERMQSAEEIHSAFLDFMEEAEKDRSSNRIY